MESGHKILWTDHALEELKRTVQYLESNFSNRDIDRLADKIETVILSISRFPNLYPETFQRKSVRRAPVTKFNTLYYRMNIKQRQIEILSFFSNREDPDKLEF